MCEIIINKKEVLKDYDSDRMKDLDCKNNNFAEFLEKLGYSQENINNIAYGSPLIDTSMTRKEFLERYDIKNTEKNMRCIRSLMRDDNLEIENYVAMVITNVQIVAYFGLGEQVYSNYLSGFSGTGKTIRECSNLAKALRSEAIKLLALELAKKGD